MERIREIIRFLVNLFTPLLDWALEHWILALIIFAALIFWAGGIKRGKGAGR